MSLEVKNISKKYNSTYAIKNISFTLNKGITGLIGANGAGKTTTMKIITNLLKKDSGEILYNGKTTDNNMDYIDNLGYLPQDFNLYPNFTVLENLEYIAYLKDIQKNKRTESINDVLNIFNLQDLKKKKYKSLSGGQKRRLGMAQALLSKPNILILDEPTVGIDPREQVKFRDYIKSYNENIVLISSHIISDIEAICDKVIILDKGILKVVDSTKNILNDMIGKVWILDNQYIKELSINTYYRTSQYKGNPVIKIIAKEQPHRKSMPVNPTLEDAYLYYML